MKIIIIFFFFLFSCSEEKAIRLVGIDGKPRELKTYVPLENSILLEQQKEFILQKSKKTKDINLASNQSSNVKILNKTQDSNNLKKFLKEDIKAVKKDNLSVIQTKPKKQPVIVSKKIKEKPQKKIKAAVKKKNIIKPKVAKLYIQVGIFSSKYRAKGAVDQISKFGETQIKEIKRKGKKSIHKVILGPITKSENIKILNQVRKKGFEDAFIRW